MQTSGLGLNPIYDWDNGKKITGYEMTTEVVVSDVAIEDAGAIISDSVNAGINSIDSVQYQCSNFYFPAFYFWENFLGTVTILHNCKYLFTVFTTCVKIGLQ